MAKTPPAVDLDDDDLDIDDGIDLTPDFNDDAVDSDDVEVPDDLVFTTADEDGSTEREVDPADVVEFKIDGQLMLAIRPKRTIFRIVIGKITNATNILEQDRAVLEFLGGCLDDESNMYINHRLHDPADSFEIDTLAQVTLALIAKWSPKDAVKLRRDRAVSRARKQRR